MSRRAQTDIVLVLGLVIFIAIILLLGWTRIVGPLLKYDYTIQVNEVALGIDAAAAAPERLQSLHLVENKYTAAGSSDVYETDRRIGECTDSDVKIDSLAGPLAACDGDGCWKNEKSAKYTKDKKLVYTCKKVFGTYAVEKTWDYEFGSGGQNVLRAV